MYLVVGSHGFDDLFCECAAMSRCTNEDMWFQSLIKDSSWKFQSFISPLHEDIVVHSFCGELKGLLKRQIDKKEVYPFGTVCH